MGRINSLELMIIMANTYWSLVLSPVFVLHRINTLNL